MRNILIIIFLVSISLTLFAQDFQVDKIEYVDLNNKSFYYPQFSPDGKNLVLTTSNYQGIWIFNLENRQLKQINNYLGAGMSPVFSDDGLHIIFRKDEYKNRRKYSSIISYNLQSIVEQILEENNRYLTKPILSSNGDVVYKKENRFQVYDKKLKYKSNTFSGKFIEANNGNLILYENNNPTTLNFTESSKYLWVSLDPDLSKILFTVTGQGTFVSDLTGEILVELGYANAPKWSPDGNWIVYMDDKDDGHQFISSDIYVVSADGSEKHKITSTQTTVQNEIEMYPRWSPDGNKIVFNTIEGKIKIAFLDIR